MLASIIFPLGNIVWYQALQNYHKCHIVVACTGSIARPWYSNTGQLKYSLLRLASNECCVLTFFLMFGPPKESDFLTTFYGLYF